MQNPEHFRAENEHMYWYRSSCIGTHDEKRGSGQPVPLQVEPVPVHSSSGQSVPVQVEPVPVHQPVPVHPSGEQPIPVQVEPVPIQVVLAAPV